MTTTKEKAPNTELTISRAQWEEMQTALAKATLAATEARAKADRYKNIAAAKVRVLRRHIPEVVEECRKAGIEYNPQSDA